MLMFNQRVIKQMDTEDLGRGWVLCHKKTGEKSHISHYIDSRK
jgi:hypothetical protein